MEKTIEIPEGYEARIEGNKVILERKESEDERIRKWIIDEIKATHDYDSPTSRKSVDDAIAYLERQKEQKPTTPKYRIGEVMRTKQEAAKGITDGLPVIVSIDDNYYYCTNEKIPISEQEEYEFPPMNMRQKPAEWSEEDVKKLAKIRESKSGTLKTEMTFYRQGVRDAFNYKGFRPSWKPSKEQMEALEVSSEYEPCIKNREYLKALYNDLKKL